MKIIFLDMDGVINNVNTFRVLKRSGLYAYDEALVSNLNYIIKETDAKIVMSSTWRLYFSTIDEINIHLEKLGIIPCCIGITPDLKGCFAWAGNYSDRGCEIQTYIVSCNYIIEKFAVIDDDHIDALSRFGKSFFK